MNAELHDQFGNSIVSEVLQGQDPLGGALMDRIQSPEMGAMGNSEMQGAMSSANLATETELEGDDGSESEVEAATRDEAGEGMESAETENLGPKKEAIQKQTTQGVQEQGPAQQGPKNDGHLPRDEHGNVKLD